MLDRDLTKLPRFYLEQIQRQALGEVTLRPRDHAAQIRYQALTGELHRRQHAATREVLPHFSLDPTRSPDQDAA